MLSVGVLEPAQASYHVEADEHYYSEGGQASSRWAGEGARALGLRGEVLATPYLRLFSGREPTTGEPIGQHQRPGGAKQTSHRPGHDFALGEIKELTVLRSCLPAAERRVIDRAREESLQVVLDYIESDLLKVRRGQGGKRLERAKGVFSIWKHASNRGGEGHEHIHIIVMNVGQGPDGRWSKVSADEVVRQASKLGAMYRMELSRRLGALGLDVRPVTRGKARVYTIDGVPREACKELSSPRARIEEKLAEMGASDAKAAERANLLTRPRKQAVSPEAVRAHTRVVAERHGFTTERALELLSQEPKRVPEHAKSQLLERALDIAITDLSRELGNFTRPDLERMVMEELQASGLGSHETLRGVGKALEQDPRLVRLEGRFARRDQPLFTTQRTQSVMTAVQEQVRSSKKSRDHELPAESRIRAAPQHERAARSVAGPGRVRCLSAESAVASAQTQEALAAAYQANGYKVIGVAPREASARAHKRATRITSYSAADALTRLDPRPHGDHRRSGRLDRVRERLGISSKEDKGALSLTPKSVVVVDQADRLPAATLHELVAVAEEARAKLVLCGDSRSNPGGAPSAYANIAKEVGEAKPIVHEKGRPIWRVLSERDFSEGQTRTGLERFTRSSSLTLRSTRSGAVHEVTSRWMEAHKPRSLMRSRPTNDVVVTRDERSKDVVNQSVQRARLEAGDVAHPCAHTRHGVLYVGDRVRVTRDAPEAQALRGDSGVLVDIESRVTHQGLCSFAIVRMDQDAPKGWMRAMRPHHVELNLEETPDWLELGYATEVEQVPDLRPDNAIVLLDPETDDAELLATSAYSDRLHLVGVRGEVLEDVERHHEVFREPQEDEQARERTAQHTRDKEPEWEQRREVWQQLELGHDPSGPEGPRSQER